MGHEWKASMTSWFFWLGAGAAPIILFLIGVGIKFFLHESEPAQWMDEVEVKRPEYFLDWLADRHKGSNPGARTYGVLDKSDGLSLDIRTEIERNDRYQFLTTVLDMDEGGFQNWKQQITGETLSDSAPFLKTLESLRTLSRDEQKELVLDPLISFGSSNSSEYADKLGNFVEEFFDWWSLNREQIATDIPTISSNFFQETAADVPSEADFQTLLRSNEIEGYFVIPETTGGDITDLLFVSRNEQPSSHTFALINWYRSVATNVLRKQRFLSAGIDSEVAQLDLIQTSIAMEELSTDERMKSVHTHPRYFLWALLYFMVLLYGVGMQSLTFSVVEEKSSKLIDHLMSNLTPGELLDGKVWGNSFVYLIMLVIWIVLFAVFVQIPWSKDLAGFSEAFSFFFNPSVVVHFLLFNLLLYGFYGYAVTAISSNYENVKNTRFVMGFFMIFLVLPFAIPAISVQFTSSDVILNGICLMPPCIPYMMIARATTTLPDWPMYLAIMAVMLFSIGVVRLLCVAPFTAGIGGEGKKV
ncbi:MAG: ABC transporter permease [Gammaproteobacteria bacterium]|nr:ABC transporter permease [Gammaproteobacteria bacterium]